MVFGDIRRARVHIRRCQAPSYGNVSDILRTLRTYFEHVCEAGTHVATHVWKAFPNCSRQLCTSVVGGQFCFACFLTGHCKSGSNFELALAGAIAKYHLRSPRLVHTWYQTGSTVLSGTTCYQTV